MKYLKKRSTHRHRKSCRKSCRKLTKRRGKTVRRRHVMRGGWGLAMSLPAPIFKKVEASKEEEDDSFVGGSWLTLV